MNEIKIPPFTPKRILLGVAFLVAFVIIYSGINNVLINTGMIPRGSVSIENGISMGAPSRVASLQYAGDGFAADEAVSYGGGNMIAKGMPPMFPEPSLLPGENPPAGISKIVKSASLSLLVRNMDESATSIAAIRMRFNGQPGNATFNEYERGVRTGEMTIWVPSEHFDGVVVEIKKLALLVESENQAVSDVSAQFVDISARLKNLKAAETQYVEIMKRSGKISEVLEVTRELNNTRSQIESLQGQLDYLSHQVALSAIHVSLKEEANPSTQTEGWRPLGVLKEALKSTLKDLTDLVDVLIVFIVKLPVLLLNLAFWGLIFWMLWKFAHILFRRLSKTVLPPSSSGGDVV